ncbi:MAG TPA: aminotransferase class I/II-fold pyridoxal phosphate-dependent enzyme, partial [Pirellulales bacterium]
MSEHTPHFRRQLHVGCPNLGDRARLLERIGDALDRRWLTNHGPYVQEFEHRLKSYLGVKHCVAVCNATVGLEIAIRGLGLAGEVIVPSFTFPATVHAIAWLGLAPVFCDVDSATHNVDPQRLEELIGPKTTGILGVHLWGNACDTNSIAEIAQRRGLRVLYDAAHAFGCGHAGQMIGNFGDAEVFSFHATKFVNAGEGGAIVTNDDELAEKFRRLRSFGLEQGEVTGLGVNGKMSEFAGAMGLT